jgi:hypothetical protein
MRALMVNNYAVGVASGCKSSQPKRQSLRRMLENVEVEDRPEVDFITHKGGWVHGYTAG